MTSWLITCLYNQQMHITAHSGIPSSSVCQMETCGVTQYNQWSAFLDSHSRLSGKVHSRTTKLGDKVHSTDWSWLTVINDDISLLATVANDRDGTEFIRFIFHSLTYPCISYTTIRAVFHLCACHCWIMLNTSESVRYIMYTINIRSHLLYFFTLYGPSRKI